MAKAQGDLTERILKVLSEEADGLEVAEVVGRLEEIDGTPSPRGVRNLLNSMSKEGLVVRRRKSGGGRGAPPYVYFHPDSAPRQLGLFADLPGVREFVVSNRTEIEREELDPEESARSEQGRSVLERIARGHLHEDAYARAIVEAAPMLAPEHPVDLIVEMASWTVDDLNRLADRATAAWDRSDSAEAERLAGELEFRLNWARRYFRRFWRLDPPVGEEIPGILELPNRARNFTRDGRRARLDEPAARERLHGRVLGERVLEVMEPGGEPHKAAVGTDASVSDVLLEHVSGSFVPPDPVAVMTAAAALKNRSKDGTFEYQDFDIFPDRLREYADHTAALEGLVISPLLRRILPERDFRHSRMAAMELRQYYEDFRVAFREARWRPIGAAPLLGVAPRPRLIFRDGRVFPLVHRLKDYEDDGLYGQIVRSEIEKFAQVVNHTLSGVGADMIYGSVVKNPEMSWLASLVFWYLHVREVKVNERKVVGEDDVYRTPFSDTAVSHLLFLGLAKQAETFQDARLFVTFRAVRRFSDIGVGEDQGSPPLLFGEDGAVRMLNENEETDWEDFVRQRVALRRERHEEGVLDPDDYRPFIYLCSKVGVSMFHAAPVFVYEQLAGEDSEQGGHFLLPRLEVAVDMRRPDRERTYLEAVLSWLASGGCDLDRAHTQSSFDVGDREQSLPVLVPDVIVLAHEAATFARDQLSEEVQDEIRDLISELRKRFGGRG